MTEVNPYLKVIDAEPEAPRAPAAANDNPYLEQLRTEDAQRLLAAHLETERHPPDQYAEGLKLARESGIPPAIAADNLVQLREERRAADFDRVIDSSPALATWLQKPENMGVARDDVENLSTLELAIRFARGATFGQLRQMIGGAERAAGELTNEVAAGVVDPFVRAGRMLQAGEGAPFLALYDQAPPVESKGAARLAEAGALLAEQGRQESAAGRPKNAAGALLYDALSALPPIGAGIAANVVAPGSGLPAFASLFAGGYYEEGRSDLNLPVGEAAERALVLGSAEFVTEAPVVALLKTPVRMLKENLRPAVARLLGSAGAKVAGLAVAEGTQEAATQTIQEAYDAGVLGQETTLGQALLNIGYAGLVGTLVGAPVGAVHTLSERIEQSRKGAEHVGGALQAAASSKTLARAPGAVEEFVRHAREAGQPVPDKVYLDAEALRTYFQEQGLDPVAEVVALVGDPVAAGEGFATGDVVIPYERFLARTANSEHAEGLKALVRLHPEDLSAAEMASPEVENRIEEIVAQHDEDAAERAEASATEPEAAQQLFTQVRDDLVATGRYDDSAAAAQAAIVRDRYVARAQRRGLGESPLELYQRSVKEIARESPAQDTNKPLVDTRLDPLIDAALSGKMPSAREAHGVSLTAALAQAGGLKPVGELRDMDAHKLRPGLISAKGMTMDDALVWAYENGFLASAPTQYLDSYSDTAPDQATLFDLIDQDLRGKPVYRIDQAQRPELERFKADVEDVARDIQAIEDATGKRAADIPRAELKRLLQERGGAAQTFHQAGKTNDGQDQEDQSGAGEAEGKAGAASGQTDVQPGAGAGPLRAEGERRQAERLGLERVRAKRAESYKSVEQAIAAQANGQLRQIPERKHLCFSTAAAASRAGLGNYVIGRINHGRDWHAVVQTEDGAIYDPTFGAWFEPGVYEQTDFAPVRVLTPAEVQAFSDTHDGVIPDPVTLGMIERTYKQSDAGDASLREGQGAAQTSPHDGAQQDLFEGYGPAEPETEGSADVQPSAPLPRYETEAELVKTGTRRIGAARIKSVEDAATALAYLGANGVERLDAVVTDKRGRPLAVIGGFKGTIDGASVYPRTLVGEAFGIEGATDMWLAHNHPSGLALLSAPDLRLYSVIREAFQGSRIKVRGLFALAGSADGVRKYDFVDHDDGRHRGETRAEQSKTVPVVERIYKRHGQLGEALTTPRIAAQVVPALAGDTPGIVFMSTQHEPIAFVPWAPERASPLKDTGGIDDLYEAAARANGAAAIIANPDGAYSTEQVINLASALQSGGMEIKVLDALNYRTDGSAPVESMAQRDTLRIQRTYKQPAYHGTPHDVDRFSTDKIGTGEGAQAYGWGLYFAENQAVAAGYQKSISYKDAVRRFRAELPDDADMGEVEDLAESGELPPKVARIVKALAADDWLGFDYPSQAITAAFRDLDAFDASDELKAAIAGYGNLYQVDIADEAVARMLDWDAPLSEQPESVRKIIEAELKRIGGSASTGERAYKELVFNAALDGAKRDGGGGGGDAGRTASKRLAELGIPGIRYLDANSRPQPYRGDPAYLAAAHSFRESGADSAAAMKGLRDAYPDAPAAELQQAANLAYGEQRGTRNLVVFDDSIITITHKDGSAVTREERREFLQSAMGQADGAKRGERGRIEFLQGGGARIVLTPRANLSTFLHETGHLWFDELITDATTPGTSPQLAADLDAVLAWLGLSVRSADGAAAVRGAVQESQHEQFARGFEAYLREGKAPSEGLRSVFAKLRDWLVALYRRAGDLRVQLSDEVRAVMDRLVASDDAIEEARAAHGYEPMLPVAEMRRLGMSDAKAKAYADSLERAREALGAKLLNDLWRKSKSAWRRELRRLATEVDDETRQSKVYNAISILAKGERLDDQELPENLKGLKLNREDLVGRYGSEFIKRLQRHKVYAKEGGESADLVAAKLGFASGDVLVEAIANTTPRKTYIRAEATRRIELSHPDSLTDGTLPDRAQAALHNSRMGQLLQSELELLGQLAREPVPTAREIRAAAERIVAGKKVADVNPHRYLVAERKAARLATKAAVAGKYAEALVYKRRQLINAKLYSEAQKAKDAIGKVDRYMAKLGKASARVNLAAGGQDFLLHVEQIKHVYGYQQLPQQRVDDWRALQGFLDELQDAGEVTAVSQRVLAAVTATQVKGHRDITVAELREAYEAVRNLAHLAHQAKMIRRGQEMVEREKAVSEMLAATEASGVKVKPLPLANRELTAIQRAGRAIDSMAIDLLRPENIFEAMDGGQAGPWHDYWFAALERAEASKQEFARRIGARLKELRKAAPGDFLAKLDQQVTVLNDVTMKRATLVALVLNTGNASNLQRLMNGGLEGKPTMTPAEVQSLREALTDDELAYVQGLWDTVDSLWPDIVELQKRVSGLPPEKVAGESFTVRGKAYKGGYWTLVYDHARSNVGEAQANDDALRTMMGAGFSKAVTPRGYQKARVEQLSAPLLLDFGSILSRHLDHVMTDLAYREAVKDIASLLRSTRIRRALIERVGQSGYDSLRGQLAYSVSASSEIAGQVARGWRRTADALLANASVSALAIRPDIALGNYAAAIVQGLDRVGVKAMLRGLWQTYGDRNETTVLIKAKSAFMRGRLEETDHWYAQELAWTAGKRGFGPAYRRVMMTLHRIAAFETERALWIGHYLSQRKAGIPEGEAVRLADKAIRQTQLANGRKDLSTFERDTAFRQTRQFMAPMFVIFGRLNESLRGVGNRRTAGARAVGLMLQMFLAPAIFALLAGRWPHDKDDDDEIGAGEWSVWLAANTLLFPFQTLPILRDAGSALEAYLTGNPINARTAPTAQAAIGIGRAGVALAENVEAYIDGDDIDWWDLTRDLISAGGPLVGLPASQYRITSRAAEAYLNDDAEDQSMARLLIYGPPKR